MAVAAVIEMLEPDGIAVARVPFGWDCGHL